MKKIIVVTGGAGFVGSNLIDLLIKKTQFNIILTGGYASFFKKIIKRKSSIDQDITIKGITKVYKEFIWVKKN